MTGSSQSTLTGALTATAGMHHLTGELCCHTSSQLSDRAEPAAVLLKRSLAPSQHTLHGPATCMGICSAQMQLHACPLHKCNLSSWRAVALAGLPPLLITLSAGSMRFTSASTDSRGSAGRGPGQLSSASVWHQQASWGGNSSVEGSCCITTSHLACAHCSSKESGAQLCLGFGSSLVGRQSLVMPIRASLHQVQQAAHEAPLSAGLSKLLGSRAGSASRACSVQTVSHCTTQETSSMFQCVEAHCMSPWVPMAPI